MASAESTESVEGAESVEGGESVEPVESAATGTLIDESGMTGVATAAGDSTADAVNEFTTHAQDSHNNAVVATTESRESLDNVAESNTVPASHDDHSDRSDAAFVAPSTLAVSSPAVSTETASDELDGDRCQHIGT